MKAPKYEMGRMCREVAVATFWALNYKLHTGGKRNTAMYLCQVRRYPVRISKLTPLERK